MDVLLLNASVYDIPSARRVGAIVYDGTCDLRLWPGPGADRDLSRVYGDGLQTALDTERKRLGVEELAMGQVVRVHPGKLHCDFLAWIATRPAEPGTERSPAPDADRLEQSVLSVLRFVADRSVEKIAFPALGPGPDALPVDERLAIVVRAAHRYQETCFAEGRAPVVEEVLVCDANGAMVSAARRKVSKLARTEEVPSPALAAATKKSKPKRATKSSAVRSKRVVARKLDADEVSQHKGRAPTYDRHKTYVVGDWFNHPKFGVGRVEAVMPGGSMEVLFENGVVKKLIHSRE